MKKTEKGFTIIEVALVLAIGALIFLVVFLAVPALQRNQRNDARKRDISNVVEAVTDYNSNNPGKALPTGQQYDVSKTKSQMQQSASAKLNKYIDTLSNTTDTVESKSDGKTQPTGQNASTSAIWIQVGYRCDGLSAITKAAARQAAVLGVMEQSNGERSIYCQDAS